MTWQEVVYYSVRCCAVAWGIVYGLRSFGSPSVKVMQVPDREAPCTDK
jgi:hypothetical protein